ncbi:CSC1-like protein 2 [Eucyclogobius newberryi]|uniref:CSC1-like protein 2 n=1 Tax=Eucyclogobius newberryi TaxID=166745 RepID=UPI003B5C9174
MYYLSFQLHIIQLLFIVWILVVVMSLFNNSGNENYFSMWLHYDIDSDLQFVMFNGITILYMLLTVYTMRRHSPKKHYKAGKRTLFLTEIPKNADEHDLKWHFEQNYTNSRVLDARICYDVAQLVSLETKRKKAQNKKKFFIDQQRKENVDSVINPKTCGRICCCFKACKKVEAVDYYTKLEADLTDKCRKEQLNAVKKPLGMAFVTFENESMVKEIFYKLPNNAPKPSNLWNGQCLDRRTVFYAPPPQNVYWENLSVTCWWGRWFIINCAVLLVLFFLTTYIILICLELDFNNNTRDNLCFLAILLLWNYTNLVPIIASLSTFLEAHWTRPRENVIMMHKCYVYLLIMVLILPSFESSSGSTSLPTNISFFVNYVMIAAFVGNAMDMLRISWLLEYVICLSLAHSAKERQNITRDQVYEFQYGQNYAWITAIFALVMTYSFTCPILILLGLVYMLMKYCVDSFNLYYSYQPKKLDMKIHSGAVCQAMAAPLMCTCWLLFFNYVHLGISWSFLITIINFVCVIGAWSYFESNPDTHNYKFDSQGVDEMETTQAAQRQLYFPQVLQDQQDPEKGDSGNKDEEDLFSQNENFLSDKDKLIF